MNEGIASQYVDGSIFVPFTPKTYVRSLSNRYPENVALGKFIASSRGIIDDQWECLYNLGMRESGWNHLAQNPISSAYGLFQFLDSTWAGTGYTKTPDPAIQIQAGLEYIRKRYGTSCNAYYFQLKNNWY